jgi:hypothetical protein
MMKSPMDAAKTPDLDFRWDPDADRSGDSENAMPGPVKQRNLEDYFNFLSEVDPGQGAIKQPPELFNQKFTF